MKGLIIYKSKYGSTKQFSEWLKEDTGFDLREISNVPSNLKDYEIIIIGCSIHAGLISLQKWIMQNWESIKGKQVILMLTSGTSDIRFIQKTMEKSLSQEIRKRITLFPVGGRYLLNRMSIFDRLSVKIVAFFTKHSETKRGMLTERDDVNRDNLKNIINFINQ